MVDTAKTIRERVEQRLRVVGINKKELSEKVGTTPQNVTNWVRRNSIPIESIFDVAQVLKCSAEWLATGRLPNALAGRKIPILSDLQAANPREAVLQALNREEGATVCLSPSETEAYGRAVFGLRMVGDSMLPKVADHDLLICDPDARPNPGDLVVASVAMHRAVIVRKYRQLAVTEDGRTMIELVPLNADFAPIRIEDPSTAGRVVATVIEHRYKP